MEDAGRYRLDSPLPPLAIPATLQDSLMARLDRLAPVKEVAQIGAAIGRDFSYTLLRCVAGRDDLTLSAALAQLEAGRAAVAARDAAGSDATASSMRWCRKRLTRACSRAGGNMLHKHIGDVLRDSFPVIAETEPEVLAYHFTEAGLSETALDGGARPASRH